MVGLAVAGLGVVNLALLGALLVGPSLPALDETALGASISEPEFSKRETESADLSLAYAKPLFAPSRLPDASASIPLNEDDGLLTGALAETDSIEFRGIITRDGVKFAVCRVAGAGSIGLYEVGDTLAGHQVLEITREHLVILENGKPRSLLLQSHSLDGVKLGGQHTQPHVTEPVADSLIIGPGHL